MGSIEMDIQTFKETGEQKRLVNAISMIFTETANGVLTMLPPQTANELGKYLDAVGDVMTAIGSSWEEFESGELTEGIELLYFGLRNATDPLIPDSINDETYETVVGTLDNVIGGLSETVMDYKQRILESSVCWRHLQPREKKRPSMCESGYRWNGEQFCFPREAAALIATTNSTEATVARKGTEETVQAKGVPTGALPAHCDTNTEFTEKQGHWCYAPCPIGFEPTGTQCRVSCKGSFHADGGPGMCGKNAGAIAQAITQMVVETFSTAFTIASHMTSMKEDGVNAEGLAVTIQTFINLGKPFAYQKCPVVP